MSLLEVPFADYIAWPAVSCSNLLELRRSPARAQWVRSNPPPPTKAMRDGAAWHCACLEPEEFATRYTVAGTCAAKTKAGADCPHVGGLYLDGEWFCRIRGHAPEGAGEPIATVLEPDKHSLIHAMRRSLWDHPKWEDTRALCGVEQSVRGVVDGLEMKARPDLWDEHRGRVIDVKSIAQIARVDTEANRLGWHIRAAHYLSTLNAAGYNAREYVYAVIASDPPHEPFLWVVTDEQLLVGRRAHRELVKQWRGCVAAGAWTGGNTQIEPLPMDVVMGGGQELTIEGVPLSHLDPGEEE